MIKDVSVSDLNQTATDEGYWPKRLFIKFFIILQFLRTVCIYFLSLEVAIRTQFNYCISNVH